jgi:hypothetical protein
MFLTNTKQTWDHEEMFVDRLAHEEWQLEQRKRLGDTSGFDTLGQ